MDKQPDFPSRRLYDRFEANTTAVVRRGFETAETVLMENISARGAAVLGYRPFAKNDKLNILFRLPFSLKRPIHKQAHVVWCSEIKEGVWEAGIDFGMDNTLLMRQ
jgi:hypothetical protein